MTPSGAGTSSRCRSSSVWTARSPQDAAVQQLSEVAQCRRPASEKGARRRLDIKRTSGLLASVLSAYHDQIDGVAQLARTQTAVHAALGQLHRSPAYGPVAEPDCGPLL
ncbi:MAG TPA: hypothetical protein VME46_04990 [Acidimicrobiales bacterium]|nr:hypothetical protein [Acidimicrobiales bacterium]